MHLIELNPDTKGAAFMAQTFFPHSRQALAARRKMNLYDILTILFHKILANFR